MDWQWDRTSDLLQNCDLPPPLKLEKKITAPKHALLLNNLYMTMQSSVCYTYVCYHLRITKWDAELEPVKQTENTSLMRALQLSQSRAREAEKKAAAVAAANEQVAALLLEESLRLSAHRQWVRLLETEILLVNRKKKFKEAAREEEEDEFPALTWCLTLAICFGIGFAISQIF